MKKITKTFYVSDFVFNGIKDDKSMLVRGDFRGTLLADCTNPIEITFSVPEKKISLSESEFDSLCYQCGDDMKRAKQKLFGESHD